MDQLTSNELAYLVNGTPSPAVPATPLTEILWPRRHRKSRSRRRGRFLMWPEEGHNQRLFPSNGYSYLCMGGKC